MIYILLYVLLTVFFISLFEENLKLYNKTIYIAIGIILFLYAGFKEVGFDNDSENYEYFFLNYDDPYIQMAVEPSYLFLSKLFNNFTNDVHIMFILYSGTGIILKMYAFRKLSEMWYLPLIVYIGNYYIVHDLTQIRAGIVSGLFLLSIIPLAKGNKKSVAVMLLIGCIFHYSTLALFPVLFMNNNPMDKKHKIMWAMLVPLGYIMYIANVNIITEIPIPYIGDKLENYQRLSERGIMGSDLDVFNPVFVVTIFTYLYILYFYDTVIKHNKYLPIMLKLTGISIFSYIFLSFLPVLAIRVSELYGIFEILIFANIFYTIKPGWLAKSIVGVVGITMFIIKVYVAEILH